MTAERNGGGGGGWGEEAKEVLSDKPCGEYYNYLLLGVSVNYPKFLWHAGEG